MFFSTFALLSALTSTMVHGAPTAAPSDLILASRANCPEGYDQDGDQCLFPADGIHAFHLIVNEQPICDGSVLPIDLILQTYNMANKVDQARPDSHRMTAFRTVRLTEQLHENDQIQLYGKNPAPGVDATGHPGYGTDPRCAHWIGTYDRNSPVNTCFVLPGDVNCAVLAQPEWDNYLLDHPQ